jgi:hypothetical protein
MLMIDVRIDSMKKLLGLVTVIAIIASSATFALANSFTDIPPGSFFEGPVDDITDAGCASGFADGTFDTSSSATRGQFALWGANCFSRSTRATSPNTPGLNGTYKTIDSPIIDIPGFPGQTQYLHVSAWYLLDSSGSQCPCDVQMRVQLADFGTGAAVSTSREIFQVVATGSGGDIDDTVHGSFWFQVPTDNSYEIRVQGQVFGVTSGGCGGNCLTLADSEVNAWTTPLDNQSAGIENGAESGPTSEEAESVHNAVLNPSGDPDK